MDAKMVWRGKSHDKEPAELTVEAFIHDDCQKFMFRVANQVGASHVVLEHGSVREVHRMLGEQLRRWDRQYCACCGRD